MQGYIINLVTLSNPQDLSISSLILKASPVVQAVLILLLLASILCWWIVVTKVLVLRRAKQDTHAFLELFWSSPQIQEVYDQSGSFENSPVAQCFQKARFKIFFVTHVLSRSLETGLRFKCL